jgi:amino acid transporter
MAIYGLSYHFVVIWLKPGILVMIATGAAVVSYIQQLNSNFLTQPWQQGLMIIAVIAFSLILSVLRFRATQNVVNVVFVAYGGAILLIGLAGLLWLFGGHSPQADFSASSWALTKNNYTFYGLVILALLGIEVPLNMGVEIANPRSITRYLLWGSTVVIVAYLIGTFGVMMAAPTSSQGSPSAVSQAVQNGFGGAGTVFGTIVTIIFIGFFLFNTAVYNYSFGRLLFVSGLDRRLPTFMSKVNANKVPWMAVLVQSIISAFFAALAFIILPYTLKTGLSSTDLSTVVYNILQAAVTIIWCISMVILFVDVIIIRQRYHEAFTRARLAPDWVFYLCSTLGLISSAFGVAVIFISPWIPALMNTTQWDLWIGGIGILSLLIGAVVFFIGQATIKTAVSDEEIIAEVTGDSSATAGALKATEPPTTE